MNKKHIYKKLEKINQCNNYLELMFFLFSIEKEQTYKSIINQVDVKFRDIIRAEMLNSNLTKFNVRNFIYVKEYSKKNAQKFLKWYFQIFKQELLYYISIKTEYVKCLYSNQFNKADILLNQIDIKCGISTWSIGQRFLLLENIGIEHNKKYLSVLSNLLNHNIILSILLSYLSMCAEKNLSYSGYQAKLKDLDDINFMKDYFIFKLDLFSDNLDDILLSKIIQVDAQLSIIDIYESIIKYIQLQYSNNIIEKELLKTILSFDVDFRVRNLKMAIMNVTQEYFDQKCEPMILQCMDCYTKGEYKQVIDFLGNYLTNHPMDFQMITLYVKSCIYLGKKITKENDLYAAIYHIYMMDNAIKESKNYLLLHAKRYMDEVSIKVYSFIQRHFGVKNDDFYFMRSILNDFNITPSFYLTQRNEADKEILLHYMSKYAKNTVILFRFMLGKEINLTNNCIIESNRKKISESILMINKMEIKESIRNLEFMRERTLEEKKLEYEKINRYLYIAYEINTNYLKMLKLYIDCYFKNSNLVNRFQIIKLRENLRFSYDIDINKCIEYPIFIYLYNMNDENSIKIAYLNFLDANNIKNSYDFICFVKTNYHNKRFHFFFFKICTIEIMKKDARFIKEKKDIEMLRVDILRELATVPEENSEEYFKEITNILSNKLIRKRKKQFDQNRIFADIKAICINCDSMFKEQFEKYCKIGKIEEALIEIDYSDLNKVFINQDSYSIETINISKEKQKKICMKTLLKGIQHEFLKGDAHGLNYYLSTRIRHGYCDSILTKAFQDAHLLLLKEKDDSVEYSINPYWDGILPTDNEGSDKIKKSLAHFSKKIGTKINEVKRVWLTIKEKNNENGLLDYTHFVDICLKIIDENNTDYNIFIDRVEMAFWVYTEIELKKIRNLIETDLKTCFNKQLVSLEKELSFINENSNISAYLSQILYDIKSTRPKLEENLNKFINVLYKQDITYEDFDIYALIEVVLNIQRSINADFSKIKLSSQVRVREQFKGKFFPYFVDLLNILIDNALKHSEIVLLEEMEIIIEIISSIDIDVYLAEIEDKEIMTDSKYKKWMQIKVFNKLNSLIDKNDVLIKFKKVLDNISNAELIKEITQKEGGSGLYKICNILKYQLETAHMIFYDIEDEFFFITIVLGYDNLFIEE